jgi:aryl-alcohol dehydrogenase-like predicted oxidoreductase
MEVRTLGRTGLRVSALALGTVELGLDYGIQAPGHFGRPSLAAAAALVDAALAAGINLLDTARAYGESEAVLGQLLHGHRDQVVLATKASAHLPDGSVPTGGALRQHLVDQLDTSLRLLRTDAVDLWQIHNVDAAVLAAQETVAETFAAMQAAGKIRWRGGSFYGAQLPVQALQLDLFDVIQVTYSVFDQRIVEHVLPLAQAQGVGVMVRSVLLKGALTERADYLPEHLAVLRERSRQFRELVAMHAPELTPAQAALAFALANQQIGSVLVGMRTVDELESNLPALTTALNAEFYAALTALRVGDEALLNPGTWGIP